MKKILYIGIAASALLGVAFTAVADQGGIPNDNASDSAYLHNKHVPVCPDEAVGDARCNAHVIVDKGGTPQVTVLPAGLSPQQIHTAYALPVAAASTKVIAIVDAYDDPNIYNDLKTYSQTYNIPVLPQCGASLTSSACFKKVNQRGATTYPVANAGWSLEIALDVEVAHATCQNCTILLVEADSNSYANLMTAVDRAVAMGATVVSNSYGSAEFSGEQTLDSHFNHSGVAFTFSSGDSGYGAQYPASSPFVTAVGGTSLYLNSNNSYNHEVAWAGAGSGCSTYEPKPLWQIDVTGCTHRTVADVSAVADPNTGAAVYDTVRYQGRAGWFKVGGTSLSAPLIAAVYALSGNTSGAANSLPYGNSTSLRDITAGSNGSCSLLYLCTAAAGFDGPTGLGTPLGVAAF